MLDELHVRDLALIDEVWLELGPGMTVLTGETGAGKTVLIGALKLLLGERADATLVRSGSTEALVEGRFTFDGQERTARRRVSADGRSRCYLDGEMVGVGELARELGPAVDLHGQHDHQELLRAGSHAAIFDRFAAAGSALEAYRSAYGAHAGAREALDSLTVAVADRGRRVETLSRLIEDVDRIAPQSGEDASIAARIPRLRHAGRLAEAVAASHRALDGEEGAGDRASEALATLARVAGLDPELDGLARELAAADAAMREASSRLRDYGESIEHDPAALESAEARLAALEVLERNYGPTLDDVLAAREAAASELAVLDEGEAGVAAARRVLEEARMVLEASAQTLAAVRDAATADFESRLAAACADLAMPTARFEVSRTALPPEAWTLEGPERLEFLYAPATGEPARPLVRIASGGEVSRVMLALKGVLGAADMVPVLVFDEIDAGIGGATASAVGRRLHLLAVDRQVLVITHLAQVAAFARAHLVVEKADSGERTATSVRSVEGDDRVAEIARMLSGTVSPTSLAHARELLDSAASEVC